MSIRNRVLVVALASAVAVVPATAASAGDKGKSKSKGKHSVSKSEQGKQRAEARKAAAKAKFTVPGTVAGAPGAATLRIARKERGMTVVREFVLAPNAVVKRNGVRVSLSSVHASDKAVAKGARVGDSLVVTSLKVEGRVAPPAPVDDSAPTTAPATTPPPIIVI